MRYAYHGFAFCVPFYDLDGFFKVFLVKSAKGFVKDKHAFFVRFEVTQRSCDRDTSCHTARKLTRVKLGILSAQTELIGLINMLQMMNDPSSIGPQMAIALITTLYGSMLANWICAPVASKLKAKNEVEMTIKEIMIEGLLSIQAGENPRVIEEKLKSFLTPDEKASMEQEGGEENG